MRFCMNDPLVKWISDHALPIIMSNDHEFVLNDKDNIDANGIRCRTISDVKQEYWKSTASYILCINEGNGHSVFDNMEDHVNNDIWTGNMDFELDIDYRFTGQTDSFEIASKDGTGCIFYELVKKALMRSKRDHIGNELPEIAVDYLADEIADDMYNNTFQDMLYQMMGVIEEAIEDQMNYDTE
eukprot:scaffold312977_cov36-Attheya_sp.AAC.1